LYYSSSGKGKITVEKRRKRQSSGKGPHSREEENNHLHTIPQSPPLNTHLLLQSCRYLHESLTAPNKLWCHLSLFIMDYHLSFGSTTNLSNGYYKIHNTIPHFRTRNKENRRKRMVLLALAVPSIADNIDELGRR